MPWTTSSVPSNISGLSDTRKRQWVQVANAAMKRGLDEGRAMAMANGVVKKTLGRSTAQKDLDELDALRLRLAEREEYIAILEASFEEDEEPELAVKESPSFFERLKGWLGFDTAPVEDEWQPGIPFQLKDLPDGRLRFLTISTNNAQDQEGETILASAHREFIAWAEKENGYPELWPWHLAGGRLGVVDWMDFDGNFLLSSGLIDVGMETKARAWAEDPETAMSHGFFPRHQDRDVVQYRQFEQSVLPRWAAANLFTDFTIGAKDMALTPQKRTTLAEKGYSEEEIAELERHTDGFRQKLASMGVSMKDLTDDPVTTKDPAPPEPSPEPPPAPAPSPEPPAVVAVAAPAAAGGFTLDDLRSVIREEVGAASKELTGRIDHLEAATKELQVSDDDKFSRMWESRRGAAPASRQETTVASKEQSGAAVDNVAWVNNIPIFQHPAFQMGGIAPGNGEVR